MCGRNCPYETFPACRVRRGPRPCRLEDKTYALEDENHRCNERQKAQAAGNSILARTDYYCPDCDTRGHRAWLKTDGFLFRCPDCHSGYGKEGLAQAYRDELEGLENDTLYVRGRLESLTALAKV